MSRKLVARTDCVENTAVAVCVYKDTEWEEYIVYYVIDGKRDEPSSYHTLGDSSQDKADAISTMLNMALVPASHIPTKARQ